MFKKNYMEEKKIKKKKKENIQRNTELLQINN